MDKKTEVGNINIKVRPEVLSIWKNSLLIEDLEITNNKNDKFHLVRIENYEMPRNDEENGHAQVIYFDKTLQVEKQKKVNFKFQETENQSYRKLQVTRDDFTITTKILEDFDFLDFSSRDIVSKREDVKILKVKVFSWNLFDQKIILKLTIQVRNIQTSIFVEFKLKIDILKLVFNLIEFNPENSFVMLNDDLKFVPEKMEILTPDANKYFNEKEIKELKRIVDEIKFYDLALKHDSGRLDIFSNKSIGSFVGTLKIRDRIFKNASVFAQYDATVLQSKITKLIKDFAIVKKIKGAPRDLELSDIFSNWKQILQSQIFEQRGFENLIEEQVGIKTSNLDIENNITEVEIFLKNSPEQEVIFTQSFTFEISLLEELSRGKGDHIIFLKNEDKLFQSPKYTEFLPVDFGSKNSAFKILEIIPFDWNEKQVFETMRKYLIKINYNNRVDFEFEKEMNFKVSHGLVKFQEINEQNVNINAITIKTPEYFQNLMNQEASTEQWIEIESEIFQKFVLDGEFRYLNFVIKGAHFKRIDFTNSNQMELRLLLKSHDLKQEKFINKNFTIDVTDIQIIFNSIEPGVIEIKNKNVLAQLPNYKLSLHDFKINEPYRIKKIAYKNNLLTSSLTCYFDIKFLDAYRTITKEFYYGDLVESVLNDEEVNKAFSLLTEKDLVIDFDEMRLDYHTYTEIKARINNYEKIYVHPLETRLLNRRGKMEVKFLLQFGNNRTILATKIKYDNPISKQDFQNYRKRVELNN